MQFEKSSTNVAFLFLSASYMQLQMKQYFFLLLVHKHLSSHTLQDPVVRKSIRLIQD